jgi:hypothetical protein
MFGLCSHAGHMRIEPRLVLHSSTDSSVGEGLHPADRDQCVC